MRPLVPFAGQLPGAGKTLLGLRICHILRRGREEAGLEEHVASRLRMCAAWAKLSNMKMTDAVIAEARASGGDTTLVLRALSALFPESANSLVALSKTEPVMVQCKDLLAPGLIKRAASPMDSGGSLLDNAFGHAIFCNAVGEQLSPQKVADIVGALDFQSVVSFLADRDHPMLILFDDIPDLADEPFSAFFPKCPAGQSRIIHCMTHFARVVLTTRVRNPGVFVFCTGRSLTLAASALSGGTSPMFLTPIMLSPLSPRDVLDSMKDTPVRGTAGFTSLAEMVCADDEVRTYLANRACAVTGGLGRPLERLLFAVSSIGRILLSTAAVDDVLKNLDVQRATKEALKLGSSSTSTDLKFGSSDWRTITRFFARMILLDMQFYSTQTVAVGNQRYEVASLATLFGIAYAPVVHRQPLGEGMTPATVPAPASGSLLIDVQPVSGSHKMKDGVTAASTVPMMLKLVVGEWAREEIRNLPDLDDPVAKKLLEAAHLFGGTLVGRAFEFLIATAILWNAAILKGKSTMGAAYPHLQSSRLALLQLPILAFSMLPRVTRRSSFLTVPQKEAMMRAGWETQNKTMKFRDFAWAMHTLCPSGTLGMPFDAQSGSSDLFVKIDGHLVGYALKAVQEDNCTTLATVQREVLKLPANNCELVADGKDENAIRDLPEDAKTTLVVYSLSVGAGIRSCMGELPALVVPPGSWTITNDVLLPFVAPETKEGDAPVVVPQTKEGDACLAAPEEIASKPQLVVPAGVEVVIVNPSRVHELVGLDSMKELKGLTESPDNLIDRLAAAYPFQVGRVRRKGY